MITVRDYPYGNLAAHILGYVGPLNEEELAAESEAVVELELASAGPSRQGRQAQVQSCSVDIDCPERSGVNATGTGKLTKGGKQERSATTGKAVRKWTLI